MLVQTGEVVARGLDAQRGRGAAAEQEIAADNRPSSLRSGGRLQLNFSRSADRDTTTATLMDLSEHWTTWYASAATLDR